VSIWKLRLTIFGTLAVIIGLSTLVLAIILDAIGAFSLTTIIPIVLIFNLLQWLMAPRMIESFCRVHEASESELPSVHRVVNELSQKCGISKPSLMIADMPIPNAFAYGSPLTGNRIAVTTGLLKTLNMDEVEAVVGHEFGHIKHKDVQAMMFISVLPSIFYYLAYSSMFTGRTNSKEKGNELAIIGTLSMFAYFALTMLSLHFSRLREYYADEFSAANVENGSTKLSEALAGIVHSTSRIGRVMNVQAFGQFKALFISDPVRAESGDATMNQIRYSTSNKQLVDELLNKGVTPVDSLLEVFSTHPNIVKRLRALQKK
jgi:heat shock protein HtpX